MSLNNSQKSQGKIKRGFILIFKFVLIFIIIADILLAIGYFWKFIELAFTLRKYNFWYLINVIWCILVATLLNWLLKLLDRKKDKKPKQKEEDSIW